MSAKANPGSESGSESPSIVVPLPSWLKLAGGVVSLWGVLVTLWGGLVTWQIQQGLEQLRLLTERVGTIDTRVAVLEERIPQPLGKELAPLVDKVGKLALELAELRGQLGGGSVAPAKAKPSVSE